MKHQNYSLPGPHAADDMFKVMGSEVYSTDNIFQKRAFPAEAFRSTNGLPSKMI